MNLSDPTGEHAKCGSPTCLICNKSRRDFINSHVDWYNRVTGSNISGVNNDGSFRYPSFAEKVGNTIGAIIYSVRASVNYGIGVGASASALGFGVGAEATITHEHTIGGEGYVESTHANTRAHITVLGLDSSLGCDWQDPNKAGKIAIENRIVLLDASIYAGIGGGVACYWDLNYVSDRIAEIWK